MTTISASPITVVVTQTSDETGTIVTTPLTSAQIVQGRTTPLAHAASHEDGGDDEVELAQSQVTNLTTDLAAKVASTRTISTTSPITGGGDLSANRTIAINDGTTSAKGAVQLEDSTSSTSTTKAATPNSVKSAYDLATAVAPRTAIIQADMPVSATSSTLSVSHAPGSIAFGGAYVYHASGADASYMEWPVALAAGTYTLRVIVTKLNSVGKIQASIDGVDVGSLYDGYNSTPTYTNFHDTTGIAVTTGAHTVRLTANGKNASSSNYYITIQGFAMTRTGA